VEPPGPRPGLELGLGRLDPRARASEGHPPPAGLLRPRAAAQGHGEEARGARGAPAEPVIRGAGPAPSDKTPPNDKGVRVSQEAVAHHHHGTELARELTLFDTINIVIGTIIGSGIFLVPSQVARAVRTPGWMLGVWVIGGVLTLLGALSLAEL